MLTDVPGVRVGHWTDPVARTGCTVALLPESTTSQMHLCRGLEVTLVRSHRASKGVIILKSRTKPEGKNR